MHKGQNLRIKYEKSFNYAYINYMTSPFSMIYTYERKLNQAFEEKVCR